ERLYALGAISGYTDTPSSHPCADAGVGSPCFLWANPVTRGQLAKIDANTAGYAESIPSTQQTFTDVAYSNPFWLYVERVALHGVISGYNTSPPCTTGVPCFRWANPATRGQTAKIAANTFFPGCSTPVRGQP